MESLTVVAVAVAVAALALYLLKGLLTRSKEQPKLEVKDFGPNRFRCGWGHLPLPIVGRVAVIDNGEPAVGLSAMQMDALNVGHGSVGIQFGDKAAVAETWNAFGPNHVEGYDKIRITDSLAEALGCTIGDDIVFTKVVTRNLPVAVRV